MKNAIINYDKAKAAIEKAWKVDEVQDIRDSAMRAQLYAKQAKDTTLMFQAAEIKLRAERKVGEILVQDAENGVRSQGVVRKAPSKTEIEKLTHKGLTQTQIAEKFGCSQGAISNALLDKRERPPRPITKRLKDYGVTIEDSKSWQRIARIAEKKFNAFLEAAKKTGNVPTTGAVERLADKAESGKRTKEREKREEERHQKARRDKADQLRKDREKVREEKARRAKLSTAERKAEDDAVELLREEEERKEQAEIRLRRKKVYEGDSPFDIFCKTIAFESLRKAYTAEALRLHPDRGGKPADMARLNKVWSAVEEFLTGTEEPTLPIWRSTSS